jgi:hypothetical protein
MKTKCLLLQFYLLGQLLLLPGVAQAQLTFTTNNGAITITGYTGNPTVLNIPSTTNGLPVTSIGQNAFISFNSLTSVTIGTNVTSIGSSAFWYCRGLTNATIPVSVTSIAPYVFGGCSSLPAIMVDTNNPIYSGVAGVLFDKSLTTLIECPGGKAGYYTIPNSVTSIGQGAFFDCSTLTNVSIPNSVTNIGVQAFDACSSLTSATIPSSVTSIGFEAFRECTSLTNVYFQCNAPSADSSVFHYDNNVTVYYLPCTTGWADFSANTGLPTVELNVSNPTLSITSPVNRQRWSNAVFTVNGTASNNVAMTNVWLQLNGGSWTNATTANGWTNWSATVNLIPGTNTVSAYAVAPCGHVSATNSVSFQFVANNQLQIRATGLGTISPNYSNAWLEIGRNYSITSTPASGFAFSNWVASTNWIGGTTTTRTNLPFMMASNLTLQVNFLDVTKPTLSITAPTAGKHMTNALATVIGTASDNWKVSVVWYQLTNKILTGGTWSLATTTNNYTNWTTTVTLAAGSNTVKAYAVDLGGNHSSTSSVSVLSSNTFKLQLNFALSQPLTSTGLNFTLQLSSNLNGHILVSTNLTSWATLTNFVGTNTTLNFRDPAATNSKSRFYRATIP